MIRVALAGAAGRMGAAVVRCITGFEGLKLVAATEQPGHAAIGKDVGAAAGGGDKGVIIAADPEAALAAADVAIVFTLHSAVPEIARAAAHLGKALVIGTTGLDEAQTAAVKEASGRVPIVWSPNMSLGVNLLFAAARQAAAALGMGYDVVIEETHHVHKKDAPSGTALRLGEKVAEGRGQDFRKVLAHVEGGRGCAARDGMIVIRSRRAGETVGDHVVSFENEGERIALSHHAKSRDAFAIGALHAARWAVGRKAGLYDMQAVLGL